MEAGVIERIEGMCRVYASAMERSDLAGVLGLFTDDATAVSPISGKQSAHEFYAYVMRVTSDRTMKLHGVLVGVPDAWGAAVHIAYTRTVAGGEPATIQAVDLFRLNESRTKFTGVTIVYDTAAVRSDFDRPEARHP